MVQNPETDRDREPPLPPSSRPKPFRSGGLLPRVMPCSASRLWALLLTFA